MWRADVVAEAPEFMRPNTTEQRRLSSRRLAAIERLAPQAPSGRARGAGSTSVRVAVQVILIALTIAVGIWVLYRLERVVVLLTLTTFFAYLVAPLVRLAEQPRHIAGTERHLPRGLAIAVIYLLLAGGGWTAGRILLPKVTEQLGEAFLRAPDYAASLRAWEQRWVAYYEQSNLPLEVRQSIDRSVLAAGDAAIENVRASLIGLVGAVAYLPWLVLIPILAFFLLKDAHRFRRAALAALPHRFRLRARGLADELNDVLAAYIRAQLLACALIGIVCGVVFAILGVPYAVLLGVIAGVLEFIPLVGPFLAAVIATVVAVFHAPILALRVVGFLAALRVLHDYVVYPRLVGRGLHHLHPFAVVIAGLAGVELGGVVGLFVAVPAAAIMSVVYRHSVEEAHQRRLTARCSTH
jgi:predicted PurR-regulated permease PerM